VSAEEPRTLSQAIGAGRCPGCPGTGWVTRFVPVEHEGPCSTCGGTGTWPPDGPYPQRPMDTSDLDPETGEAYGADEQL
jgi:hypothetical protein